MKIAIVSDIHCRNDKFPEGFDLGKFPESDVLVAAGDFGTAMSYPAVLSRLEKAAAGRFGHLVTVKGNHDFYYTDKAWLKKHKNEFLQVPTVWDNYTLSFDNVMFVCSPLWTPISGKNGDLVTEAMNDYNYIQGFSTERSTTLFYENLVYIETKIADAKNRKMKTVVVTHHLPLPELVSKKFEGDPVNEAFCVLEPNAVERIRRIEPDLWIHGHSHDFLDATVGKTRYVRNPYGYEWAKHDYDGAKKEDTGFVEGFTVEV